MRVQISKWGNSLGVRLPKAVAEELALKPGQTVDVVVEQGSVAIRPQRKRKSVTLAALVAEMDRLGREHEPELVDWGPDVGAEIVEDNWSDIAPGSGRSRMGRSRRRARPRAAGRKNRSRSK